MPWRSTRKSSTLVEAVRGVSFDVPRGEVLGIVGRNGSGKSTLLRAIAGVIAPSDGRITIRGRVAPLLSVGTGFNNALSGRDNITLGCLALGLEPAEIDRRADGIAEFTGLGDALERPVRTYSSGMYARLGFAVSTSVEPDVLLIDEVLSPGDADFKVRAGQRIEELVGAGRTVVIVSHGLPMLGALSSRCMWIDQGCVNMAGEPSDVLEAFTEAQGVAMGSKDLVRYLDSKIADPATGD